MHSLVHSQTCSLTRPPTTRRHTSIHHNRAPRATLQVLLGSAPVEIEKGVIFGSPDSGGRTQPMAARALGFGRKSSLTVWKHIDFLKIKLTRFFCTHTLNHIKMTRILTLYFVYLVNMTRFGIFLPLCLLPYQNDTNSHAIFCLYGQYDITPTRRPRHAYRAWCLDVSYFPLPLWIGTMLA